jgi:hypothetical protein
MRLRGGLTAACALLAIIAQPAGAATVRVADLGCDDPGRSRFCTDRVEYEAAAGERNDVSVIAPNGMRNANGPITIGDSGATVDAGQGCTQDDPHRVTCRLPHFDGTHRVQVLLGDQDDAVRSDTWPILARGGPGSDRVTGGPGVDRLDGGPGEDVVDGGVGEGDVADYSDRADAVSVDMAAGTMSDATGDTDKLQNIEGAAGGEGSDALTGGPARDLIDGGGGADVLRGLGGADEVNGGAGEDQVEGGDGDDVVEGGRGADALDGGAGDDSLSPRAGADGERDSANVFRCGTGRDYIEPAGARDLVGGDCEIVQAGRTLWTIGLARPLRSLRDPVAVIGGFGALAQARWYCRGAMCPRVTLTAAGRTIGERTITSPRRRRFHNPAIRLNSYGRRLVANRPRVRARLTITARNRHDRGSFLIDVATALTFGKLADT